MNSVSKSIALLPICISLSIKYLCFNIFLIFIYEIQSKFHSPFSHFISSYLFYYYYYFSSSSFANEDNVTRECNELSLLFSFFLFFIHSFSSFFIYFFSFYCSLSLSDVSFVLNDLPQ